MKLTIHRDGQSYGPYTLEEIRTYLTTGQLSLSDLALSEGDADWIPLGKVPGIESPEAPPPPQSAVSAKTKGSEWKKKGCIGCAAGAGVLLLLFALLGAIGGMASSKNDAHATQEAPAHSDFKVGDAIQTSTLGIMVRSVSLRTSIGSDMFQSTPSEGGVYVVVRWTYKNMSTQPLSSWSTPDVKLVDANGVEYSPDVGATSDYATEGNLDTKIVSDLSPGIQVEDAEVFEISQEAIAKPGWKVKIEADRDVLFNIINFSEN